MKKGFTLIELLVVVMIIGVLTLIAVPQYDMAVERTRMTEAATNIKILLEGANRYYLGAGAFPANISELDVNIQGTISGNTLYTKYYYYTIYSNPTYFSVLAYRKPAAGNSPYHIYIDGGLPNPNFPKRLKCTVVANGNPTPVQEKLCEQIVANGNI